MLEEWTAITSAPQYFSFLEAHHLVVVYFTAPWCFRCQLLAPKLAGLPQDLTEVTFAQVDLQAVEELGDALDIATLPTFVLSREGAEVHRLAGVPQQRPARALVAAIRRHLLPDSGGKGGE